MRAKLVLCILLTIICASSKSQTLVGKTIKGDSLILTDSTGHVYFEAIQPIAPATATAKKKKMLRPQRIDREIMKTTFIPKGQWMAGGTVSYSEHEDVLRGLRAVQGHNVAAGVRFAYNRTYLDMSNFELNLGEDFNINLKDLYWLEHKYEVSGFLRTYMPIGKSKIFGLFNEVRLTYGYSTGKNSTGSGTEYDGTFERAHNLQIGIAPGMAAFITNWSAVEVSVGVMGYNFKWQNQTTNQIESGTRRTSSGNFKINLFSINIGMTFYL